MPLDLSERLERLHEQELKLPKYRLVIKDGISYAMFNNHDFMLWEELLPEVFVDFVMSMCREGCCVTFELGRMQ